MAANIDADGILGASFPAVQRNELSTLQVNLGYRCNQACHHCHVDAGPNRTEMMNSETAQVVIKFASAQNIRQVDLTGGAPELHPEFRALVTELRDRDIEVIDRCNLTVLKEPEQGDLAAFLASAGVKIVASMPCHGERLVDLQRGKGGIGSKRRPVKFYRRGAAALGRRSCALRRSRQHRRYDAGTGLRRYRKTDFGSRGKTNVKPRV